MTEQDYSDQWPESLRIMREQRERIAELEAEVERLRELSSAQLRLLEISDERIGELKSEAERRLKLLQQVYAQIGNHAPAERRHAVTPGCRDAIRDELNAARAAGE